MSVERSSEVRLRPAMPDLRRMNGHKKGNVAVAGYKASADENGRRQPQRQPLAACELSADTALDLPKQLCDRCPAFLPSCPGTR